MTDRSSRSADRPPRAGGMGPDRGGASGGRRISPGVIFLVVAIVGSIAYMAYTVTVRDTSQIPLLASGAIVLAVVFAVAFEPAFLAFHRLFFSEGTYLFGPDSNLIKLFPEGFWFESSLVAGATIVLAAVLAALRGRRLLRGASAG